MKHPLVNPSLTPHGFGRGNTYRRSLLKDFDNGSMNGDWMAARFWQEANRKSAEFRPVEFIIHEIMPGMKTIGQTHSGDFEFEGRLYQENDIAVLSAVATWLGTNCGHAMLENRFVINFSKTNEYRVRWKAYEKYQRTGFLLRHILHECSTTTCNWGRKDSCSKYHVPATPREELVLDAFLFWLGQTSGRDYLAKFAEYRDRLSKNAWEAYKKRNKIRLEQRRMLFSS